MSIDKGVLGLAGEYSVAAELCRMGIYSQLTLGNRKRTDILVVTKNERFIRLEVKSKQRSVWGLCKGIFGQNVFIVFVDFEKKSENERPDYYILSVKDWKKIVKKQVRDDKVKKPNANIEVDEENCYVSINKAGKDTKGHSVYPKVIEEHKEGWDQLKDYLDNN